MSANFKAELTACFGQPMAENPTGVMQEAAFAALGLNWRYLTVEVAPAKLREAVAGARAFGLRGFNCTIPHKVAVMEYLDEIAPDAAVIGAVNTVRRVGGSGSSARIPTARDFCAAWAWMQALIRRASAQ
jgi:shikimate dehydrogenase